MQQTKEKDFRPTKAELELETFENYVDKEYFEREPDWQEYEFVRKEREYIQQIGNVIFLQFKEEILKRTNTADTKRLFYKEISDSKIFTELMQVIKDWFDIAVAEKIIDGNLIESYKKQFNDNKIFYNEDVTEGFLLASGNVSLKASGDATVVALGKATISASDNVIVFPSDNTYIKISGAVTVFISGEAQNYAFKENGESKIFTIDNTIVEAWGNTTCVTYRNATEVKLKEPSIPEETKELISVLEQAAKMQNKEDIGSKAEKRRQNFYLI